MSLNKKDKRDKLWTELESKIQKRAKKKDKKFVLSGKWKKLVRKQEGISIYSVDGEWVRNNLSVTFGHGGHGYVHEFIPLNEIWIDIYHSEGCECENVRNLQKVSKAFFESTLLHELVELKKMRKGMIYWKAHQIALNKEIESGLLEDPHKEIKTPKDER